MSRRLTYLERAALAGVGGTVLGFAVWNLWRIFRDLFNDEP